MGTNQHLKLQIKPNKKGKTKKRHEISSMKVATCECGKRFLVVPDIEAMNKAVKNHIIKEKCDENILVKQILKTVTE